MAKMLPRDMGDEDRTIDVPKARTTSDPGFAVNTGQNARYDNPSCAKCGSSYCEHANGCDGGGRGMY